MSGIVAKLDGVTLDAPVWLVRPGGDLSTVTSADGGAAFGHLVIDDKDGMVRIKGWQRITLDVPACTDAPRLFTGYVGQRTYSRGPYKHGPGRYITCELYDQNVLLAMRLLTGGDVVREAESDTDRLAWIIGSDYLDGLVQDLGLVNGTGLEFDGANYHGQYVTDVLRDLTSTYEQIFFVYWDQVAETAGLFFDFADANTNVSTMKISNSMSDVLGDMDGLTVYPFLDGELVVDPIEVYSNIRAVGSGVVTYLTKQATADEFFTDNDLLRRGVQWELDKIGKLTTLITFGNRYLDAHDHETETLTCTVRLPATQVNLIDAGMLIPVKITHLPDYGLDDFTNMRVQSRSVTQPLLFDKSSGDLDALYDVTLTLALTGKHSIGGGSGGGGGVPQQPPATPSVVQTGCGSNLGSSVDLVFANPISAGHMLVAFIVSRGSSTFVAPPDGTWSTVDAGDLSTGLSQSPLAMYYKIADSTENGQTSLQFTSSNGSSRPKILGWELDGVGNPTDFVSNFIQTGASGSLPALTTTTNGIAIAGISTGSDNPEPASLTPDDNFYVEAGDHFWATALGADYVPVGSSTTFSFSFTVSGGGALWAGIAAFFPSSGATSEGPAHGQWSKWKVITMTGDAGNIGFAYATGSLEIKVDGVLISPASYVETDNTTGAFTLNWTTDTDEVVTARAQGI